jgi:hypothetical protein
MLAAMYEIARLAGSFAAHGIWSVSDGTTLSKQNYPELADAFFAGVDSHERAAPVWNAHLDPSI